MGDYDGIKEREEGKKKMPVGMTVLFIGLIVFGVAYMYLFSPQTTGWKQADQYQRRMETLKQNVMTHEAKEAAGGETGAMEAQGPAIYASDCAMCHGEKLEGGVGPALMGPKFIYGNTLADHIRVITDGTPKGMPGFAKQLGPEKIRAVAQYVHTRHTHTK